MKKIIIFLLIATAQKDLHPHIERTRQGLEYNRPHSRREPISDPLEFQLSLKNDVIPEMSTLPTIGKYGPGYSQGSRLALIELQPQMLRNNETINRVLTKRYGNIETALTKNVEAYIQIRRAPYESAPFNVVLHRWGERLFPNQMFSHNFTVGIFDAEGIEPTGAAVPFNSLAAQNVNRHNGGGIAYSPNNMQFQPKGGTILSSFWLVAISPDNNNISVNFIIFAHNDDTYEKLRLANRTSPTLGHLLHNLFTADDIRDDGILMLAITTMEELMQIEPDDAENFVNRTRHEYGNYKLDNPSQLYSYLAPTNHTKQTKQVALVSKNNPRTQKQHEKKKAVLNIKVGYRAQHCS